jgi:hypothetical protein
MNNRGNFLSREDFLAFYETLSPDEEYKIDFFGGEPLLNWDIIKFIVEKVKKDKRFKGFYIPSNGLLLNQEMVDYIIQNNIRFCWSCDGLAESNTEQYREKSRYIRQLCNKVISIATPDSLNFIENHIFFRDTFGVTPSINLVKSGWDDVSVGYFKRNYSEYIDYLVGEFKVRREGIPSNILNDISSVVTYAKSGMGRKSCAEFGRVCLMPGGKTGFCAILCTNGDYCMPVEDDPIYSGCKECDAQHYCAKECYGQAKMEGGMNKYLCELYKFLISESMRLHTMLRDDIVWQKRYFGRI